MEESILKSTKKILGLADDYTPFDLDVITHINAAFSLLDQLGIGQPGGFFIADESSVWDDFIAPPNQLNLVKTYIFLKVRMLFDPPSSSFLINAMNDQIKEYEWRLNVYRDCTSSRSYSRSNLTVRRGGVMNLADIELGRNFIAQVDYSAQKRQDLANKGQAMPHGGYPITNIAGLKRAIQAFGRAKDKVKTKAWIIRRARELNAVDVLPDGWVSAKQSNVLDFIDHFGTKGMRWGVRKDRSGGGTPSRQTDRTTFGKSPKQLTNAELERRIKRMDTEKRYNELNKRDISAGEKLATEIITNVGRSVVTTVATGAILFGVKQGIEKKFAGKLGEEGAAAAARMITKRGK
jgi:hypothetical protein